MLGLNASLNTATQALAAQSSALAISNNNIANLNTPGYSRQIVNLSAEALIQGGTSQDNGVSFGGFTSVRDQVLQLGIQQKTSDASSLSSQSASLSQINNAFSGTESGLGAAISTFFSSFSALSATPTDAAARQAALSAAGQLTDAFHQAASVFSTAQGNADSTVASTVAQINQLTKQIADLNGQLSTVQGSGHDGGSTQDQRDQLTTQLAGLVGVSSIQTDQNPTLTLSNGSPLAINDAAFTLQVSRGTDGQMHILDNQGKDITSTLTGGTLGGALTLRDQTVPQFSDTLNQFASQFASAMNTAQASGYDQTGAGGQPLFSLGSNGIGAAASISVALSSGSSLALSSDGAGGSSGNVSNILAVQTQALPSGQSPTDTYAALVQKVGTAGSTANSELTATNAALTQLTTQRDATSGVSVDEETTNVLRYQQAYTAAAKVISTLDSLFSVVMNMGSGVN